MTRIIAPKAPSFLALIPTYFFPFDQFSFLFENFLSTLIEPLPKNDNGTQASYSWDYENRLSNSVLPGGGIDTYLWDGDGQWREKRYTGGATRFVYDGVNLFQRINAANNLTGGHYTDFPGEWGMLTSQNQDGVSTFFGADVQSNTRLLTNSGGSQSDSYSLSAFGETLASSGTTFNPFLFGGEFGYYQDTGYFVRARFYDPLTSQWFSSDPIGFDGGDWNLYRFVANDPVLLFDPSGLSSDSGGGRNTVRYSITTYIPYGIVPSKSKQWHSPIKGGKLQNPIPGIVFFKGNGRGPSSNSGRFKTQVNFRLNICTGKIVFIPFPAGPTDVVGANSKGYHGVGTYNPLTNYVKEPWGYHVTINGASLIPYYPQALTKLITGWSGAIRHSIILDLDRNGKRIGGSSSASHSRFPSLEIWSYRNGSAPNLEFNYDVRRYPNLTPGDLTADDREISF